MTSPQTHRHQVILNEDLIKRIEAWRRQAPGIPNKSEAIRLLLEVALRVEEGRKG